MLLVAVIGAFAGLLGGLFGKGGSAIATPVLHLIGVPALTAVASPLPATIPSTLIAALAYHRAGAIDRGVLRTTVIVGVPATVAGAVATHWVGGGALILLTDLLVAALGLRVLTKRSKPAPRGAAALVTAGEVVATGPLGTIAPREEEGAIGGGGAGPFTGPAKPALIALGVGLASGLLGNSGGFLLAPLFATVLHLRLKTALGTSLAAAAVLAVPGTIVHAAMGHIDWTVTALFGAASIPLSAAGARLAIRTSTARLEVLYGTALLVLGGGLLLIR